MEDAETLKAMLRLTLNIAEQGHHYPQGLLARLADEQARIFWELSRNHTPRPEWLENWGKAEVEAAAHDPAERVRIAKLAARARWRGHVKKLKKKLQAQYGEYLNADGLLAALSAKFVDKGFSGTARSKSYQNGVPNLVHLHAARDIVSLWKKSRFIEQRDSYHAWEPKTIKYGRYETSFRKNGDKYIAIITTKNNTIENTRILYSIEVFKAKK